MKRLIPVLATAAVAVLVLVLTSCGSGTADKTAQASGGAHGGRAAAPSGAAKSTIGTRSTAHGRVLVGANGRTLYLFEADRRNMSNCSGACLSIWPAFSANATPKAEAGAVAAKVGTIAASGGKRQVTYNGHPLYYYAGDQQPGDTAGQGLDQFGAKWYVLAASGNKVDDD